MEYENDELIVLMEKVWYVVKAHWLLLAVVLILCSGTGYGVARFAITPVYRASADMLVNNSQEISNTTITTSDITASTTLVKTYAVILKSHIVVEQVIKDLDLPYSYKEMEKMISVQAVNGTQVMRISVEDISAERAKEIVTKIVELAPEVIINAVEAGSVKMVDMPWTTGLPISPNKKLYMAAAGGLGLLFCVGVLFLQDMMNNTFKTEEDVRKVLGLPILSVIPVIDEKEQSPKKKK